MTTEEGKHCGLQVGCRIGLVSKVYFVASGVIYRERKLAVAKVVGRRRAVIQPLEQVAEGEQPLVEHAEKLGI